MSTSIVFNGIAYAWGVSIDDARNIIYVADTNGHRLWAKDMTTGRTWTLAGTGVAGFADGGPGVCRITGPYGVAASPSTGNIFVSVSNGYHAIRMVTPAGFCSTIAGSTSGATGFADGVGTNARFDSPLNVALDDLAGFLYVADYSVF